MRSMQASSNDHLLSIHIHQIKLAAKHILDGLMHAQNYLLYININVVL